MKYRTIYAIPALLAASCSVGQGATSADVQQEQEDCQLGEFECAVLGRWNITTLPPGGGFFGLIFKTQKYEMEFRPNGHFYGETQVKSWQEGDAANFELIDVQQIGQWEVVNGELRVYDLTARASIDRSSMSAERRNAELVAEANSGEDAAAFFEERYSGEMRGALSIEGDGGCRLATRLYFRFAPTKPLARSYPIRVTILALARF